MIGLRLCNVIWIGCALVLGCAPKDEPDAGGDTTGDGSADGDDGHADGTGDGDGGDDGDGDDDDDDDDGCGGEMPGEWAPDTDLEPLDQPPWYDGTFGASLSVNVGNVGDAPFYYATMQVFDVLAPGNAVECGAEIDPLDGLDDCRLRYRAGFGFGDEAVIDWLDAGEATAFGPDFSEPMAPEGMNSQAVFFSDLGHEPAWNGEHGVGWEGADVPPAEMRNAVTLPPELLLSSHELVEGTVLPAADLALEWTGQSSEPVEISMIFHEDPYQFSQAFDLRCGVHDDGAFTVPGELLSIIPPGWYASFRITRGTMAEHDLGERRLRATASVYIDGTFQIEE